MEIKAEDRAILIECPVCGRKPGLHCAAFEVENATWNHPQRFSSYIFQVQAVTRRLRGN